MNPSRNDSSLALSAVGRAAPLLLLALAVACGDSGSGGSGGDGANGTTGGNNTGGDATGAGNTGGTGTTGGGGQGTGGTSVMCTEPGTNVPTGECDLILQDCPVATDTCAIVGGANGPTTGCITLNGLKGMGESCASENDCKAHLTCVGSVCTPFCCAGGDALCMGGTCDLNVTLIGMNNMPEQCGAEDCTFRVCSFAATCNLFDPNACAADENCYFKSAGLATCATPAGGPGNEVPDGGMCAASNACGESTVCISEDMTNYFCHYLCQGGSSAAPGLGGCPNGQSCDLNSFDTGFANVGVCK